MSGIASVGAQRSPASLFAALESQPADVLLALIGLHAADPRPHKIDVGVGVYRDARGRTPVFRSVKAAERRLAVEQATKAYLGPEGDARFVDLLAGIVFGRDVARSDRLTGVQAPGGTGALRLGAGLLARAAPGQRVWIGAPTWPNHQQIFAAAGMTVRMHPFFDTARASIDFAGMIDALGSASRGDIVLLQGCCHNPTGTGFSPDQWSELAALMRAHRLIPFIDMAYQGLGGGLDEDAEGLRILLRTVDEALIAYSCDKNFGLYRERVGALWVLTANHPTRTIVRETMLTLSRSLWSMPPDHGAAVVRMILEDERLEQDWRAELEHMRGRIDHLRASLARALPALAPIAEQRGLFALLPITTETVASLREQHGIYMPASGRINIAGLREDTIPVFAAALAPFIS